MKYMIIEKFHPGKVRELYQRFDQKGRLLPPGVIYLDSWINDKVDTCFQLMEAESPALLDQWIQNWKDLADFEYYPVIDSARAKELALSTEG